MPKIKICGLTRQGDIDAVNLYLPDYIGFVFAPSRRQVTVQTATALKARLVGKIKAVGVFVNEEPDVIADLCRQNVIDLVQLHGDEDNDYISRLKDKISMPIIKAVRVQSPQQVLTAQGLPCDYLLLDTFHKGAYGGTGTSFDYRLIPPLEKPFFIAGGLDSGNIAKAADARPFGLDVSSGVETDGVKNADKIKEIIKLARAL